MNIDPPRKAGGGSVFLADDIAPRVQELRHETGTGLKNPHAGSRTRAETEE
jgi:hypothetical protein